MFDRTASTGMIRGMLNLPVIALSTVLRDVGESPVLTDAEDRRSFFWGLRQANTRDIWLYSNRHLLRPLSLTMHQKNDCTVLSATRHR
jgi:hypothetical protein